MTRGVLAGAAGNLWLRLTSLIAIPLLIDELGISLYGVWAITDVLIAGQGIIDLGVLDATVKFVADADTDDNPAAARRVILYALAWYTLLNLAVAAVVLALIGSAPGWLDVPPAQTDDARILLAGGALLFAISNYSYVFGHALLGMQDAATLNVVYGASRLPYLALLVMTAMLDWGATGVVLATAVMYAIQVAWLAVIIRRRLPRRARADVQAVTVRDLARFGSRTYVAALADFVVLQAPKLVATRTGGAASAGRFDLASRIPVVAASASYPLQGPTVAAAARLTRQSRDDDLTALIARVTRYLLLVMLPLFGAIMIAGPDALRIWIGDSADGLAATLRWLVPGMFVNAVLVGILAVLMGNNAPGVVARYKVVLLLATLGFMVGAGTRWDLPGIAGGLSVASAFAAVYLGILVHRRFGSGPLAETARASWRPTCATALAAALCACVAVLGIGDGPWLALVVFLTTYGAVILAVRGITRDDTRLIRDAFRSPVVHTDPLGVEV